MGSEKQNKKKKCTNSTSMRAVDLVEQGEQIEHIEHIRKTVIDWGEFWHLFCGWFISALIIVVVLTILTMAERSQNIPRDVILRLDTLSLMFSLVLSAGLEQVWNNKKQWIYKLTLYAELALAFIGLALYLYYSISKVLDPENPYLQERFGVHLFYIITSIMIVITGFFSRACLDKEVN